LARLVLLLNKRRVSENHRRQNQTKLISIIHSPRAIEEAPGPCKDASCWRPVFSARESVEYGAKRRKHERPWRSACRSRPCSCLKGCARNRMFGGKAAVGWT